MCHARWSKTVLVGVLLLTACQGGPFKNDGYRQGAACSSQMTCPPGQTCKDGLCLYRCTRPGPCQSGEACECNNHDSRTMVQCAADLFCRTICGSDEPDGASCAAGKPCPAGQTCGVDGACHCPCTRPGPCTGGGACECQGGSGGQPRVCDVDKLCKLECGSGTPLACATGGPGCPAGLACDGLSNICRPQCEGLSCPTGAACAAAGGSGTCQVCRPAPSGSAAFAVIVTTVSGAPFEIALGATDVYWGLQSGGIQAVAKRGGVVRTVVSGHRRPQKLLVQEPAVYWTEDDGSVWQAPADGGGIPKELYRGTGDAFGLAVADGVLYWTMGSGTVFAQDLATGVRRMLASGLPNPRAIAVASGRAFFLDKMDEALRGLDVATGLVTVLATGQGQSGNRGTLVLGNGRVYWTSPDHGTLSSVAATPAAGVKIESLATGQSGMAWLALLDDTLYWTRPNPSPSVRKLPTVGGEPALVADAIGSPGALTVDAVAVYWVEILSGSTGLVMKVAR